MPNQILIIEDEVLLRESIATILALEGFEVLEAGDGPTGLHMAQDHLPDLILCDIALPGMEGFQILEALRSSFNTATTPLIFITGRGEHEDVRRGMALGADDYLIKPFRNEELLQTIRARMTRQASIERNRLHTLSSRLVEAQEQENHRIARELHDEVGSSLTGLKLVLDVTRSAVPAELRNNLDRAMSLVDNLVNQIRSLSLDLRPTMLDHLGLLPTLMAYFNRYTAQTSVQVNFKHWRVERRFAQEIEIVAYRLIQEALTNVARHAQVETVNVWLWVTQETLRLQIEDHGPGFDLSTAINSGNSTGLSSMYERARLVGGYLSVETFPSRGTRFFAGLPVGELNEEEKVETGILDMPQEDLTEEAFEADLTPEMAVTQVARWQVMLADGHAAVRQGIQRLLGTETDFELVGMAALGRQALDLLDTTEPDLLLLDLALPDMDGFDVLRALRARERSVRVLVLSLHEDEAYAIKALRLGALGFVLKSGNAQQLMAAMRAVASGRRYLGPPLTEDSLRAYIRAQRARSATGPIADS